MLAVRPGGLSRSRRRANGGLNKVAETIICAGGSAEPVATDATLEQDVVRLFDRAMAPGDGFEPADLVVSNAGNNQRIEFRELTARQFEDFWRVGCFSGFLVRARGCAPARAIRSRGCDLHRRFGQRPRQAGIFAFLGRQGRPSHDLAEDGAQSGRSADHGTRRRRFDALPRSRTGRPTAPFESGAGSGIASRP
jgi:hypothetical protein